MKLSDIEKDGSLNLINNSRRKTDIIKIKDLDVNYDIPYMSMVESIKQYGFTDIVYNNPITKRLYDSISEYDFFNYRDNLSFHVSHDKMSNKGCRKGW